DLDANTARNMAWRSLVRGGNWNDFVCGQGWTAYPNPTKLTYYGYLLSFLSTRAVPFWQMTPNPALTSTGLASAKSGSNYLVYAETTSPISVDLSNAAGTLNYEWYNTTDGTTTRNGSVQGGAVQSFTPPSSSHVLWITGTGTISA